MLLKLSTSISRNPSAASDSATSAALRTRQQSPVSASSKSYLRQPNSTLHRLSACSICYSTLQFLFGFSSILNSSPIHNPCNLPHYQSLLLSFSSTPNQTPPSTITANSFPPVFAFNSVKPPNPMSNSKKRLFPPISHGMNSVSLLVNKSRMLRRVCFLNDRVLGHTS
jgi:hypothetical protein